MSNAYLLSPSSSPPLPPTVATSYTADDGNIAIPDTNNLNVLSRDTSDNNDNGIQTTADPNSSDNLFVELTNRITGTVTTTDATPTTIASVSLGATPGVYYVTGSILAYDVTDTAGAAYSFSGAARTDGATATEISTEEKDIFEEAALSTADFNLIVTGNSAAIQVIGIAAKIINWSCLVTYRFVG